MQFVHSKICMFTYRNKHLDMSQVLMCIYIIINMQFGMPQFAYICIMNMHLGIHYNLLFSFLILLAK